jgi:hypothetical protein
MRHVLRAILLTPLACAPSQEATRVALPVALAAGPPATGTTDLGWAVELTGARVAVRDLQFTIQGEMHGATAWLGWLVPTAWAHPGHYAGGDVTGELLGEFVLDWGGPGGELGVAELLTGQYNGFNFTFRAAGDADGLAADDPLRGHTAHFAGVARKDGVAVAFSAVLDVDDGTQMVGGPLDDEVTAESDETIVLAFNPVDPVDGDALFDGVDFAALDPDGDGQAQILPGEVAHNVVRRALQSHVHYAAEAD